MSQLCFEIIKKQYIKELNSETYFYRHVKTGAEILSVVNDDENKVFGITFRTPPGDSTGVAHILEHSVLCGSRKYPVKEPFVELLKSSLQTFLNAMTYPDKTCYPVASQNVKDFYNLVDVYLDAVFYPGIDRHVFEQEGWHYEADNPEAPLSIKGVVYNEMKGVVSSPETLLSLYSQYSLFPDNTYGLESGGDPKKIPDLSYDQFVEFHRRYYHPSNSKIFFYGDDDPARRLDIIEDYLKDFDKKNVASEVRLQKRFNSPKKLEKYYAAESGPRQKPKSMITVNWLLCESTDKHENFFLRILSYILIGMPASPLKKALIESELGEGITGGLENEILQMYFSAGLKGIDSANSERIEKLIFDTLDDIVKNGIDKLTIEAAFNTIEFAFRENNTGSYPRGLSLMLRSLTTWLYDSDPLALIEYDELIRHVRKQYELNPSFFEGMIGRYMLNNNHRTTVVLIPDPEMGEKERKLEMEYLSEKKNEFSGNDLYEIINNVKKLKEIQETPDPEEAIAKIPALTLNEIEKLNKIIPVEEYSRAGNPVYYHDLFTNGILYLDIGLNLNALPQKYLPYLILFGKVLLEMGTEKEDYVEFSQRIRSKTGGIGYNGFSTLKKDTKDPNIFIFFKAKAMIHQVDDLMNIIRDMFMTVRLDNRDRFRQIVLETKSGLEQSIIPGGHGIVNIRIRSHYNSADWAEEQMKGITALFFLRKLQERVESGWKDVLYDLEEIRKILVNRNNLIINATLDEKNWNACSGNVLKITEQLPEISSDSAEWIPQNGIEFEGMTIPSKVNYVGIGTDLFSRGYKYHGSINVITRFLRTGYLWDRIRVQGGAYGAMCQFSKVTGILTLLSYRDPNLKKTIDVYDGAADYLKNAALTEKELHKTIIGAIGEIDSYMLPDAKGYASMIRKINGDTDEDRQLIRDQVLGTTVADIRNFADVLDHIKTKRIIKVLGDQNAINSAFDEGNRPEMVKVL